jgi:hypothetical protein
VLWCNSLKKKKKKNVPTLAGRFRPIEDTMHLLRDPCH